MFILHSPPDLLLFPCFLSPVGTGNRWRLVSRASLEQGCPLANLCLDHLSPLWLLSDHAIVNDSHQGYRSSQDWFFFFHAPPAYSQIAPALTGFLKDAHARLAADSDLKSHFAILSSLEAVCELSLFPDLSFEKHEIVPLPDSYTRFLGSIHSFAT